MNAKFGGWDSVAPTTPPGRKVVDMDTVEVEPFSVSGLPSCEGCRFRVVNLLPLYKNALKRTGGVGNRSCVFDDDSAVVEDSIASKSQSSSASIR